jgi:hypothetical protein
MTNVTTPFGFFPLDKIDGDENNGAVRSFYAPSTYATNLFLYQPVSLLTSTNGTSNSAVIRGYQPGTLPVVIAGVGTSHIPLLGVIVGFEPVQGAESTVYGKASTDRIVKVCVDPFQIYRVKDNGAAALGITAVGLCADMIAGTGSVYTGISGDALDAGTTTTPAVTAYQWRIVGADNRQGNDATLAYANWHVQLNQSIYGNAVVGY